MKYVINHETSVALTISGRHSAVKPATLPEGGARSVPNMLISINFDIGNIVNWCCTRYVPRPLPPRHDTVSITPHQFAESTKRSVDVSCVLHLLKAHRECEFLSSVSIKVTLDRQNLSFIANIHDDEKCFVTDLVTDVDHNKWVRIPM